MSSKGASAGSSCMTRWIISFGVLIFLSELMTDYLPVVIDPKQQSDNLDSKLEVIKSSWRGAQGNDIVNSGM